MFKNVTAIINLICRIKYYAYELINEKVSVIRLNDITWFNMKISQISTLYFTYWYYKNAYTIYIFFNFKFTEGSINGNIIKSIGYKYHYLSRDPIPDNLLQATLFITIILWNLLLSFILGERLKILLRLAIFHKNHFWKVLFFFVHHYFLHNVLWAKYWSWLNEMINWEMTFCNVW